MPVVEQRDSPRGFQCSPAASIQVDEFPAVLQRSAAGCPRANEHFVGTMTYTFCAPSGEYYCMKAGVKSVTTNGWCGPTQAPGSRRTLDLHSADLDEARRPFEECHAADWKLCSGPVDVIWRWRASHVLLHRARLRIDFPAFSVRTETGSHMPMTPGATSRRKFVRLLRDRRCKPQRGLRTTT